MGRSGEVATCPCKSRNFTRFLHISIVFVIGYLCGHAIWKRLDPAMTSPTEECEQMDKLRAIRMRVTSEHLKSGEFDLTPEERALERNDNFLFIGIMTARKFLDTRAYASSKTWVPRVPGQVVYFLGEGEEYKGDLNVVQLTGVMEEDYPPQKKSFAMVDYMSKHYGHKYKWFIRADDDVYMKVDELVRFLKSINDSVPRYVGQPGFGKPVEEGKLGLAGAFCMGGPGVIMTPQVLMGVAPGLKDCLGLTVTGHEDTELGRCITITTGVQCTTNFEMKKLFYQNYAELDLPNSSFKKELGKDEIDALTLHPVKEAPYVFRMDNFFTQLAIEKLEAKKTDLRSQIDFLDRVTTSPGNFSRKQYFVESTAPAVEPIQIPPESSPDVMPKPDVNLENVQLLPTERSQYQDAGDAWDFLRYKRWFSTTLEAGKIEYPMIFKRRVGMHEDMTNAIKSLPRYSKTAPKFVNETFHRVSANRGTEALYYVLKFSKGKKFIEPFYLRRPFHQRNLDFREADVYDEDTGGEGKPIYMLMPLFQRSAIYRRFLDMFAVTAAGYKGKLQLRLVVFVDELGEHKLLSAMTYTALSTYPHLDIRVLYINEPFNRGKGLMAAQADLPYNSLLLFMDVDMEFSSLFLHRVSKFTVKGKSTLFPVYFVHYNPESICYKEDDCDVVLNSRGDKVGLWRSFSYGIGSVYKSDLVKAGGFKTDIVGWGLEDVDFFEKCLNIGLDVVRGSDPSMIHRYHPRECNMSLPENQLVQCLDSGNAMLGSVSNLYRMLSDISDGQGVL